MTPWLLVVITTTTATLAIVRSEVMPYDLVFGCGMQWSPSFLSESTETDDVIINISHRAMPHWLDLIENSTYNVSTSWPTYWNVSAVFTLMYHGSALDFNSYVDNLQHLPPLAGAHHSTTTTSTNSDAANSPTDNNNNEINNSDTYNNDNDNNHQNTNNNNNIDTNDDSSPMGNNNNEADSTTNNNNINSYRQTSVICAKDKDNSEVSPIVHRLVTPTELTQDCVSILSVVVLTNQTLRSVVRAVCKPTECRQYFTSHSGHVTSPNYPQFYPDNVDCNFTIISSQGRHIDIQIQTMDLEPSYSGKCVDYVTISYDDVTGDQLCGSVTSDELSVYRYIIESDVVWVRFSSDSKINGKGFSATYTTKRENAWDTVHEDHKGTVVSPEYPKTYLPNTHSKSTIQLPETYRIIIKVIFLDLGNDTAQPCSNDSLTIIDLKSNTSTILSCSKSHFYSSNRVIFESSSSEVEIQFTSDHINEGRGFQLFYTGVPSCKNKTLSGNSGILSSPNFPNNYPNSQQCFYKMDPEHSDVQGTSSIEFRFSSFFTESDEMNSKFRNNLCDRDFVEVFSPSFSSSRRLCGDWRGKEYLIVLSNLTTPLVFSFISDDEGTEPGFLATWRKVTGVNGSCPISNIDSDWSKFELVYSPQTWLDSELDCRSRGGHLARLDDIVTHREIEMHIEQRACRNQDAFWIGANDRTWESDFYWSNGGKVRFTNWFPGWPDSDEFGQPSDDGLANEDCVEVRRRFHLPWKGSQDAGSYFWNDRNCDVKNPYICRIGQQPQPVDTSTSCDVNITLTYLKRTINITSSNYPSNYNDFSDCRIHITAPPTSLIEIQFSDFHLESGSSGGVCDYDYLEIGTETSKTTTVCGDWFEKKKLLDRVTDTNVIELRFVSDHSRSFRGFSFTASVWTGSWKCGGEPWLYRHNECIVLSTRPLAHLEAKEECQLNQSQLMQDLNQNGLGDVLAELLTQHLSFVKDIDTLEGNIELWLRNTPQQSKCQALKILYSPNDLDGIIIQDMTLVELSCDTDRHFLCIKSPFQTDHEDSFRSFTEAGNLTLSQYLDLNPYPSDLNLTWTFEAPDGFQILLEVSSLDIEFQNDCLYDYLQVTSSSLGENRLCGFDNSSETVHYIVSDGNIVNVQLISDATISGGGFTLFWDWVNMTDCVQDLVINDTSREILSLNFPKPYPASINCSITLRAHDSRQGKLVFEFTHLKPLTFLDSVSIQLGEQEAVVPLDSKIYEQNPLPVFVSGEGFLRLFYASLQGLASQDGFMADVMAVSDTFQASERFAEITPGNPVAIYSINYPEYTPADVTEPITIRAPIGYNIIITVSRFDFLDKPLSDCSVVVSGTDVSLGADHSKEIGQICLDGEALKEEIVEELTSSKIADIGGQQLREKRDSSKAGQHNSFDVDGTVFGNLTSYLNRVKVSLRVGSKVRFQLQAEAVQDPDYLSKTATLESMSFDQCREEPCLNNGRCIQDGDRASCNCTSQYTGLFCQSLWCSVSPCNHGWCNMTTGGYTCTCHDDHWGLRCEMNADQCARRHCNDRGECRPGNTTDPQCDCDQQWTGLMCEQRVVAGSLEMTLGQRLLKEPIWIGLIVILSVLLLFGILYIIRRKCGKHFNCCEVQKPKVDDNILNADGTITLNSFPLRKINRASALSPLSISPASTRPVTPRLSTDTPTPLPTSNNEKAAARFFASYKDAERSPIAAPLTTDFTRTTDTSLAHGTSDSAVGAIVGGRLLLDLHVKEKKKEEETMSRSKSLLEPGPTSNQNKQKIKRSHSTGPYLVRQEAQYDDESIHAHFSDPNLSETSNSKRVTINELEHIYPNVIVHGPSDLTVLDIHSNEVSTNSSRRPSEETTTIHKQTQSFRDRSGAHVIAVDVDGDSEGQDIIQHIERDVEFSPSPHDIDENHRARSISPSNVVLEERKKDSRHLRFSSPRGPQTTVSVRHGSDSYHEECEQSPHHRHSSKRGDHPGIQTVQQTSLASSAGIYHEDYDDSYHQRYLAEQEEHILIERQKLAIYADVLAQWKERARQRYMMAKVSSRRDRMDNRFNKRHTERSSKNRSVPCEYHQRQSFVHPLRRTLTVDEDSVYYSDANRRRQRFTRKPKRMFSSFEELNQHHARTGRLSVFDHSNTSQFSSCDCPACAFQNSGSMTSTISSVSLKDLKYVRRSDSRHRHGSGSSEPLRTSSRSRHEYPGLTKAQTRQQKQFVSKTSSRGGQTPCESSTDSDKNRRKSRVVRKRRPESTSGASFDKPPYPRIQIISAPSVDSSESRDVFQEVFSQEVELDDFSPVDEYEDIIDVPRSTSREILYALATEEANHGSSISVPNNSLSHQENDIPRLENSSSTLNPGSLRQGTTTSEPSTDIGGPPPLATTRSNSVVTVSSNCLEDRLPKTRSIEKLQSKKSSPSLESPGTPTTCNVIMYSSPSHRGTPPISKAKAFLTRKHSSLDLSDAARSQKQQQQQHHHHSNTDLHHYSTDVYQQSGLRNAASMHDLSHSDGMNISLGDKAGSTTASSGYLSGKSSNTLSNLAISHLDPRTDSSNYLDTLPSKSSNNGTGIVSKSRPVSIGITAAPYNASGQNSDMRTDRNKPSTDVSVTSSNTTSPEQTSTLIASNSSHHLSVTDTDSAMSSAPSPQSTPTIVKSSVSFERSIDTKVKDSAYQTKQSSMEAEAVTDARIRRSVGSLREEKSREEDPKVTQRLHQAAVKLLVMQQRLRRARQHLSRDSAVHTISEDDATLDDIVVTSPKSRTFKPGVLYPAMQVSEEVTSSRCSRILEEQDTLTEYEV